MPDRLAPNGTSERATLWFGNAGEEDGGIVLLSAVGLMTGIATGLLILRRRVHAGKATALVESGKFDQLLDGGLVLIVLLGLISGIAAIASAWS
jgi:hypothetical protein